jgi:hypothetical protein
MGFFDNVGQRIQNRWENIQAHPIQNLISGVSGRLAPGSGIGLNKLFQYYNDHNFNNAADRLQQNITDQGQRAGNNFMDKPLDGPLGSVQGGQGNNSDLAQAFLGGGNQANSGNLNMSNQFGNFGHGSYNSPNVGGLLDFLGQAPSNGPGGTFANGGAMQHGSDPGSQGGGMGGGFGGLGGFGQGGGYAGLGNMGSLGSQAQLSGSNIGANTVFGGSWGAPGGGGALRDPGRISKSRN